MKRVICGLGLFFAITSVVIGGWGPPVNNNYHHTGGDIRGVKSGTTFTFEYKIGPPSGYSFATISGGVIDKNGNAVAVKTSTVECNISMSGTLSKPGSGGGTVTWSATATGKVDFYIESNPSPAIVAKGSSAAFTAKDDSGTAVSVDWTIGSQTGTGTSITSSTTHSASIYTVTATRTDPAQSANATLRVVEVASVLASPTGGVPATSLTDVASSAPHAYVEAGKSVALTATPNPTSSWPTSNPVWSGAVTGNGPTKSFTKAKTDDCSNCAEYTMTATCGTSSKVVKVVVGDILGSPNDLVVDAYRTTIGVGETVIVMLKPFNTFSNVAFTVSNGVKDPNYDQFTAPNRKGTVVVTATTGEGITFTKTYTVIEPGGITLVQTPNTGIWHEQYSLSCGFMANFHITPATVSFKAISTQEQDPTGVGTGYLLSKNGETHDLGGWSGYGAVVAGVGTKGNNADSVVAGPYTVTPYDTGQFTWNIEVKFRVGANDSGKVFATQTHKEVTDSNGNLTLSKGALSFTKNASAQDSTF